MLRLNQRYRVRWATVACLDDDNAILNTVAKRSFNGAHHRGSRFTGANYKDAAILAEVVLPVRNPQHVTFTHKEPLHGGKGIGCRQSLSKDSQDLFAACWVCYENCWVKLHRQAASAVLFYCAR